MTRFLADEMLGTVAKWLRILGFDTECARGVDDAGILKKAKSEDRVLLTRDRALYERARGSGLDALYLENANLERDMELILERWKPEPERFMTRCSLCNSELLEVDKETVNGKVPQGVYERQDRFWYCPKCDKYYWEGSHRNKMMDFIRKVSGSKRGK